MKNLMLLLVLASSLIALPQSDAQEAADTSLVRIETSDGNEYIGTILSQDDKTIQLKTQTVGTISIQKSIVVSIQPVKQTEMRGHQYWFENPHATTRYFFNPSGYGLPAGEGYYQNAWIFFNQVSVGITDNISLGVGMVPTFLFALGQGSVQTPIWFTPKLSIPIKKDKVNLGVGALHVALLGDGGAGEGAGILYGVATFGPKDHNLSMGLGWGYAIGGGVGDRPTISVSYIKRRSPKWAFLTENYYVNTGDDAGLLLSAGARFMGKKISIDFGGMTFILSGDQGTFPVIPWLSLSIPFGKKGK